MDSVLGPEIKIQILLWALISARISTDFCYSGGSPSSSGHICQNPLQNKRFRCVVAHNEIPYETNGKSTILAILCRPPPGGDPGAKTGSPASVGNVRYQLWLDVFAVIPSFCHNAGPRGFAAPHAFTMGTPGQK